MEGEGGREGRRGGGRIGERTVIKTPLSQFPTCRHKLSRGSTHTCPIHLHGGDHPTSGITEEHAPVLLRPEHMVDGYGAVEVPGESHHYSVGASGVLVEHHLLETVARGEQDEVLWDYGWG